MSPQPYLTRQSAEKVSKSQLKRREDPFIFPKTELARSSVASSGLGNAVVMRFVVNFAGLVVGATVVVKAVVLAVVIDVVILLVVIVKGLFVVVVLLVVLVSGLLVDIVGTNRGT